MMRNHHSLPWKCLIFAGHFGRDLQTAAMAEVVPFSYLFVNCFSCDQIFCFKKGFLKPCYLRDQYCLDEKSSGVCWMSTERGSLWLSGKICYLLHRNFEVALTALVGALFEGPMLPLCSWLLKQSFYQELYWAATDVMQIPGNIISARKVKYLLNT